MTNHWVIFCLTDWPSIGVCLQGPIALLVDLFVIHVRESYIYNLGAGCVVIGFVLANLRTAKSRNRETDLQESLSPN